MARTILIKPCKEFNEYYEKHFNRRLEATVRSFLQVQSGLVKHPPVKPFYYCNKRVHNWYYATSYESAKMFRITINIPSVKLSFPLRFSQYRVRIYNTLKSMEC